jgi:hypothetical protein
LCGLQAAQLRSEFNIDIRVLGIADSKHMLISEGGVDLNHWREDWEANKTLTNLEVCTAGADQHCNQHSQRTPAGSKQEWQQLGTAGVAAAGHCRSVFLSHRRVMPA